MASGGKKRKKRTLTVPVDVVPEPVASEVSNEEPDRGFNRALTIRTGPPSIDELEEPEGDDDVPPAPPLDSDDAEAGPEKPRAPITVELQLTADELAAAGEADEVSGEEELALEDLEEIPTASVPPKPPVPSTPPGSIPPPMPGGDEQSKPAGAKSGPAVTGKSVDISLDDLEESEEARAKADATEEEDESEDGTASDKKADLDAPIRGGAATIKMDLAEIKAVQVRAESEAAAKAEKAADGADADDAADKEPEEADDEPSVEIEPPESDAEEEADADGDAEASAEGEAAEVDATEAEEKQAVIDDVAEPLFIPKPDDIMKPAPEEDEEEAETEEVDADADVDADTEVVDEQEEDEEEGEEAAADGSDDESEEAEEVEELDVDVDVEVDADEEPSPEETKSEASGERAPAPPPPPPPPEDRKEEPADEADDETEAEEEEPAADEAESEPEAEPGDDDESADEEDRATIETPADDKEAEAAAEDDDGEESDEATPESVLVGVIQVIGTGVPEAPKKQTLDDAAEKEAAAAAGADDEVEIELEVEADDESGESDESDELDESDEAPEDEGDAEEGTEELDLSEAEIMRDSDVPIGAKSGAAEDVDGGPKTPLPTAATLADALPPPPPTENKGKPKVSPPPVSPPMASPMVPPPPPGDAMPKTRRKGPKPWWEEMFNDDYFRSLPKYSERQTRKEVDFIQAALGIKEGGMLLDLACGNGRHSVDMANRGFQVVGLDLSLPMLARAAERAQKNNQKINFIHGDMRQIAFDSTFDGAYCIGTSFGYFDDDTNTKVIDGIRRALKPRGMVLIEVSNRDFIVTQQPNMVWFEGDGCVCMEESTFNHITSRLKIKRTILLEAGRQVEQEFTIRMYSLHELGKILHVAGFRVLEVSGHIHTPGAFFGHESSNLIILAEKRA